MVSLSCLGCFLLI
jgi:hypothetical protein